MLELKFFYVFSKQYLHFDNNLIRKFKCLNMKKSTIFTNIIKSILNILLLFQDYFRLRFQNFNNSTEVCISNYMC